MEKCVLSDKFKLVIEPDVLYIFTAPERTLADRLEFMRTNKVVKRCVPERIIAYLSQGRRQTYVHNKKIVKSIVIYPLYALRDFNVKPLRISVPSEYLICIALAAISAVYILLLSIVSSPFFLCCSYHTTHHG